MTVSYGPSASVVREHIEYLRATASEPQWRRGDASLELLLGLRDPEIDAELGAIAPQLGSGTGDWSLNASFVQEVLSDRSEQRVVTVVERTTSALGLAWFESTPEDTSRVVRQLAASMAERSSSFGVPSAVFASVCELLQRARVDVPETLKEIVPDRWMERTALDAAITSQTTGARVHGERTIWPPNCPAALIRDPLTGLLSRSVLVEDPHRFRLPGGAQITMLPSSGAVLADVDRMKQILDYWGRRTGDHVLRGVSDVLQRRFGDNVIRFGGDEFLIVCDEGDVASVASAAVHAVRKLRIGSYEAPHEVVPVTISAGASSGSDLLEMLRRAEDALGRAKTGGRDQFVTV